MKTVVRALLILSIAAIAGCADFSGPFSDPFSIGGGGGGGTVTGGAGGEGGY